MTRARWIVACAAAAVALAVAGLVLILTTPASSAAPSGGNLAVVDQQLTARVIGQVDSGLQRILTYSYSDPQPTQAAASQVLEGDAATQYQQLFAALRSKAAGQKLTLKATVVTAGVTELSRDQAQLLVFLDQSSTRASDGTTSTSAAQIKVSAVLSGGRWKINELHPF